MVVVWDEKSGCWTFPLREGPSKVGAIEVWEVGLFGALLVLSLNAQPASAGCAEVFVADQGPSVEIAAVQYPIEYGLSLERLLTKLRVWVSEALVGRHAGAESLIVFPELVGLDLLDPARGRDEEQSRQLVEVAQTLTPKVFAAISTLAQERGVAILAGSFPRWEAGRVFNSALLVFPDGKQVVQDKLFLTPDEVQWGWSQGDVLRVVSSPWGKVVILVCYDSEFPLVSNLLAEHRPQLILVPSMTSDAQGFARVQYSARARAVEHYAYVVHVGTVGGDKGLGSYYGRAGVMMPQDAGFGVHEKEGENKPGVLRMTLDFSALKNARTRAGIYPARDQGLRRNPIQVVGE